MTTRRKVSHSPKPPAPRKPAPPKKPVEPPPVVEPPPSTIDPPPDAESPEDTGDAGISFGVLGGGVTPDVPNAALGGARRAQKAVDKAKEQTAREREAAVRDGFLHPHLR